jgi:uncharacterized membrane protein (DUF2068 family)
MSRSDRKKKSSAEHDRGLLLIGLFKLCKAVFFFAVGMGAIRYLHLHKDLGDEVQRLAAALHFDTESHFVELLTRHVDAITPHRLKQIGLATFAYSALALTEGIGLMKEKAWAEYLTLGLTIGFLPFEVFELIRRVDGFRVGMLVLNIVVLGYLLVVLAEKRKAQNGRAGT